MGTKKKKETSKGRDEPLDEKQRQLAGYDSDAARLKRRAADKVTSPVQGLAA